MATCAKRLWDDPEALSCVRTDPHHTGHVYHATEADVPHFEPEEN